jgi:hypothetical protein
MIAGEFAASGAEEKRKNESHGKRKNPFALRLAVTWSHDRSPASFCLCVGLWSCFEQ